MPYLLLFPNIFPLNHLSAIWQSHKFDPPLPYCLHESVFMNSVISVCLSVCLVLSPTLWFIFRQPSLLPTSGSLITFVLFLQPVEGDSGVGRNAAGVLAVNITMLGSHWEKRGIFNNTSLPGNASLQWIKSLSTKTSVKRIDNYLCVQLLQPA